MSVEEQHYSIMSRNFRYIRRANEFEELYDHRIDPNELTNIAGNPAVEGELKTHRDQMDLLLEQ